MNQSLRCSQSTLISQPAHRALYQSRTTTSGRQQRWTPAVPYRDSRVARACTVAVVSNDPAVRNQFAEQKIVTMASTVPDAVEQRTGTMVVTDGATVLLSVIDPVSGEETGVWSERTNFAVVFVQLIESFFPTAIADDDDNEIGR